MEVADSEGDAWNQNRCTNKANIAALKLTINVNHEQRELRLESLYEWVHEQRELRHSLSLYEWVHEQRELRHSLRVYMNGYMNEGSDMYKYILTNTIPLIDRPQHRSHTKHNVTLLTPFIDIP